MAIYYTFALNDKLRARGFAPGPQENSVAAPRTPAPPCAPARRLSGCARPSLRLPAVGLRSGLRKRSLWLAYSTTGRGTRARRRPRSLIRSDGEFQKRFAARQKI